MDNDNTQLAMETTRRLIEYEGWKNTFFSGADVRFFLFDTVNRENIELPTVAAIGFNLEEQVLPVRAYNEVKFRHVARGARLVTGSIAIFYTERNAFINHINSLVVESVEEDDDEPGVTPQQSMWEEVEQTSSQITGQLFGDNGTKFNEAPFDLMITVGAVLSVSDTAHLINGIEIVSYQTRISNDGQVLVDEYQFIAKDYITTTQSRIIGEQSADKKAGLTDSINSKPDGRAITTPQSSASTNRTTVGGNTSGQTSANRSGGNNNQILP
jgi:hypothetical protein